MIEGKVEEFMMINFEKHHRFQIANRWKVGCKFGHMVGRSYRDELSLLSFHFLSYHMGNVIIS